MIKNVITNEAEFQKWRGKVKIENNKKKLLKIEYAQ